MQRILNLICVLGYRMHRMCSRYLLQKEMKIHNAFEFYIAWQSQREKKIVWFRFLPPVMEKYWKRGEDLRS